MTMLGDVLKRNFNGPSTSPKKSASRLRDIIQKVNAALIFGIKEYYGGVVAIEICGGGLGHARRNENNDSRFWTDLATVLDSRKTTFGYVNHFA